VRSSRARTTSPARPYRAALFGSREGAASVAEEAVEAEEPGPDPLSDGLILAPRSATVSVASVGIRASTFATHSRHRSPAES